MESLEIVSKDEIIGRIVMIRGEKVLLDVHLADIYKVETRALKQAVRRNMDLFPNDFMFTLTKEEIAMMVSHSVIPSLQSLGGSSPFAFTEAGVAMLSSVLKSQRARLMNIYIMRAFVALRSMILDSSRLKAEIEKIKSDVAGQTKNIELIFRCLDELLKEDQSTGQERLPIGFEIRHKNGNQ